MASGPDESALAGDQNTDRMFSASGCDQDSDRSPVYGTDPGWNQQQQQHDARACEENEQTDQEPAPPAALTKSEWSQIRAAAPAYTESDLQRDLTKLATRAGIAYPVGVIITALRSGEPIYSRQELQDRATAMAPPVPESAPDDRSAPVRPERRRSTRPPTERHIEAAPVSEEDLDQAAALEARVRALAPDADDEDIGSLITALAAGATDAEALAQMEADRAVRAANPSSDEVDHALREHARQRARR